MDKDLYYSLVLDKYLEEKNLSREQMQLLEEAEKYFIEKSKKNGRFAFLMEWIMLN